MSKLQWDQDTERLYETGTKMGVLYPKAPTGEYSDGVAWNGLTAVTESPSGAEETALYADDTKYLSLRSVEEFGATIEAYTYPDEFAQCDGSAALVTGVYIGQQTRKPFGFCYRTAVGNDAEGDDFGYKLHLIYGCSASPSEKSYATINDSPEAVTFSWEITTVPVEVTGHKKTSTLIIDSTKLDAAGLAALAELEDILYGTEVTEPRLPLPDEVAALFGGATTFHTVTFNMNGHGTAPATQHVVDGGYAARPVDPTVEGYTFGGWYNEAGTTTTFSFDTPIEDDKTLYAKWTSA